MADCMVPGNLQNNVVILTKNRDLLRTTLADGIESIARKLNERFVVRDHQVTKILEAVVRQPEDGVSELIAIIKGSQRYYDEFIQCLSDLGYTGLVQKLKGTGTAAVGTTEKGTGSDSVGTTEVVPKTKMNNTAPLPTMPWLRPSSVRDRRMSDVDLRKITSNYEYLVDNIRDPIQLCERLHQKGVFDKSDIDKCRDIVDKLGWRITTERLLLILSNRGDVYDTFIECLKECGYNSVLDRLENDDGGNLPNQVVLTKYSQLLRTTLADRIEIVTRKLHGSFAVTDKQMKYILETVVQQPEDGVSVLINIIKDRQENFDKFIQCLSDLEYEGLVRKLQDRHSIDIR